METTEQQSLFQASDKNQKSAKTRNCNHCGKEYNYKLDSSLYCGSTCRAMAGEKKSKDSASGVYETESAKPGKSGGADSRFAMAAYTGLQPQAVYIIKDQERKIDRLEKEIDDKKSKLETIRAEKEKLQNEIATIKTDYRIKEIEDKKPTGLQGLKESGILEMFMPYVGPGLGKLVDKLVDGGSSLQISGVDGQLDGEASQEMQNIARWYGALPKEGQKMVYHVIDGFANVQPEQLGSVLQQILNLMANGTTASAAPTEQRKVYGF
jgi:hypothetical protein